MKTLFCYVGGKGREIKRISQHIPPYEVYVEPFIGGGAVYFSLDSSRNVINDTDSNLISIYQAVKDGHLSSFGAEMNYYDLSGNKEVFENYCKIINDSVDAAPLKDSTSSSLDKAVSRLMIQNMSFRGIVEYKNGRTQGIFNTKRVRGLHHTHKVQGNRKVCECLTYHKYFPKKMKDKDRYESLLQRTTIHNESFETIFERYNDSKYFFFLDPPYEKTVGYQTAFTENHHRKLSECFKNTNSKCLMIVNDTPLMRELYDGYISECYEFRYFMHKTRQGNKHLLIKNY